MSYEMAPMRQVKTRTPAGRVVTSSIYMDDLGPVGLGDLGVTPVTVPDSVWAGLPKAGDSKDNIRIAYAKRDLGLALAGDATALNNIRQQALGSATAVGKAWYNRAVQYYNQSRTVAPAAPRVVAPAPTLTTATLHPMVTEVLKAGLDIQQQTQPNGGTATVAVNPSTGAVVSKPLPIPVANVTNPVVLPANAVQAPAPNAPAPPRSPVQKDSGVLSILDKLNQQIEAAASNNAAAAAQSYLTIPSGGGSAPATTTDTGAPALQTTDVAGAGSSGIFSNPMVLAAAGLALAFLLRKK